MNVLVYTRPRIKTFFHELAERVPSFNNIIYASDHKGEEDVWIMEYYYQAKNEVEVSGIKPKTDLNINDVIKRCRYLRSIDHSKARIKVIAMTLGIERLVEKFKIDLAFGMVMDSFVLDIIDQVMRQKNSQYLGFLNNMINGYSRLTARGELMQLSETSDEDIQKALGDLSRKNYVPNMQNDFMWKTTPFSMFFTKYLKEKAKITYYFLKKKIDKDPDNFYYNTVASSHCMSCRSLGQLYYRNYEESNWLDLVNQAKKEGKIVIYLPLQFYPECSLDYWGTSLELADFYSVVEQLLKNKYEKVLIITKEHPSANALRKTDFYKSFNLNNDVVLAPFDMPSNDLMQYADVVLTWTGSVGVEAIMRDKPLITLGNAYYDPGKGILTLETMNDLKRLDSVAYDFYKQSHVESEGLKQEMIKYMLDGLIPGYVFPLDYGSENNPLNNHEIEKLAAGIDFNALVIKENGPYKLRSGSL